MPVESNSPTKSGEQHSFLRQPARHLHEAAARREERLDGGGRIPCLNRSCPPSSSILLRRNWSVVCGPYFSASCSSSFALEVWSYRSLVIAHGIPRHKAGNPVSLLAGTSRLGHRTSRRHRWPWTQGLPLPDPPTVCSRPATMSAPCG